MAALGKHRFLMQTNKRWEICLFGVFLKETQENEQCGWVGFQEASASGAGPQQPAKELGGVPQRVPQGELMEDLIASQFKGSRKSQSETSVRVSQKTWNF